MVERKFLEQQWGEPLCSRPLRQAVAWSETDGTSPLHSAIEPNTKVKTITHISSVAIAVRPLRVAVIIAGARPNWDSERVARWVCDVAKRRNHAEFEIVDLEDYCLPPFDDPSRAVASTRKKPPRAWAAKIAAVNAFVVVTPDYSRRTNAKLRNAIGQLHHAWRHKAVGFVAGGSSSTQLREIVRAAEMADVPREVGLLDEFEDCTRFKPELYQEEALVDLLSQVVDWGHALRSLQVDDEYFRPQSAYRRSRS